MTPEESRALPLVKVNAAALKAKKAERAKPSNKSDFVKQHPKLSAAEVVALAAKQGVRISRQLVYVVRGNVSKPAGAGSTAQPAVKRGPGRPRKHPLPVVAAPAPVKRGPGRPRKHPLPVAAVAAAAPVKRGPGRPRKHPLPVVAAVAAAPAVRRGPGRPRKDGGAGASHLTADEKQFAGLLLTVGLARAEQLLAGLKRALGV